MRNFKKKSMGQLQSSQRPGTCGNGVKINYHKFTVLRAWWKKVKTFRGLLRKTVLIIGPGRKIRVNKCDWQSDVKNPHVLIFAKEIELLTAGFARLRGRRCGRIPASADHVSVILRPHMAVAVHSWTTRLDSASSWLSGWLSEGEWGCLVAASLMSSNK